MRYPDLASGARAYRAIRDAVAQTPGVQSSALTSAVPLGPSLQAGVGAEGQPMTDGTRLITAVRMVTSGYFGSLRIRLLAGRDFTDRDAPNAPLVAIVMILLLAGAIPTWPHSRRWGYGPSGGIGLVLLVILVLVLMGKL